MKVRRARVRNSGQSRLTAIPDTGRRLPQGFVIEASIAARLRNTRLLTVDTSIVVTPARITGSRPVTAADRAGSSPQLPARSADAPRSDGHAPQLADASDGRGPRLAEAVRALDDGARLLAQARGNPRRI